MQLIGIRLEKCKGVKKGGIPGSMTTEKEKQATTGACHKPFFTNG